MRLREPLYGARVASMHLVIHLSLLVNMFIVDYNIWMPDLGAIAD